MISCVSPKEKLNKKVKFRMRFCCAITVCAPHKLIGVVEAQAYNYLSELELKKDCCL